MQYMGSGTENGAAVEEIVAARLRVDQSAFDDGTAFDAEPLRADSLDMVEVAEAIEANLGVHLPDEDLDAIETVGDLKSVIQDRRE